MHAQDGFVFDAWLANWDVVGQGYDNMLVDADGTVWRVDAGGALEYRAKGTPKGGNFGDKVGELSSLKDPSLNPTAAKVFGGISKAQLDEQAKVLQSISPNDIMHLAEKHDMGHVGPVLIARRKSILDQLGITDDGAGGHPDLEALLNEEPKATVPSGVTPLPDWFPKLDSPGSPTPKPAPPGPVHVNNYRLAIDGLATVPVTASDWNDPEFANHVLVRDGDLYVPDGTPEAGVIGGHHGDYKNLFTGEIRHLYIDDGQDEVLDGYSWDNVDNLVEQLSVGRANAVDEIVARTWNFPLTDLTSAHINKPDDPAAFRYGGSGLTNFKTLATLIDNRRFGAPGPNGSREFPLVGGSMSPGEEKQIWEIIGFKVNGDLGDGVTLRRRDATGYTDVTLTPDQFNASGPWYAPSNDTTGHIWKSKYLPDDTAGDGNLTLDEKTKIVAKQQDVDDVLALLGPDGPEIPDPDHAGMVEVISDEGFGKTIRIPESKHAAYLNAEWSPGMEDDDTPKFDPELEALLAKEQAIADKLAADKTAVAKTAAAPTFDKKTLNGVVASLGPGTPFLSTEMAVTDLDQMKADLIGKPIVVLPIEAHDNPDWEPDVPLDYMNGLGVVNDVVHLDEVGLLGRVGGQEAGRHDQRQDARREHDRHLRQRHVRRLPEGVHPGHRDRDPANPGVQEERRHHRQRHQDRRADHEELAQDGGHRR